MPRHRAAEVPAATPQPTNKLRPGAVRPHIKKGNSQAHPGVSALNPITHRNTGYQPLPRPLGLPPYHYDLSDHFPDIAQQINVPPGTYGVVVTGVDPSSPAASALTSGDVIQEINHKPISDVNDYRQAMAAVGKQQSVLLLVNHGGVTRYSVVEPQ